MLSLKGKGVCGGVTLGTLAVLRRNTAAVKRCKVQNAEAEVARFQTARQDAIDKLAELYEKAVADVGKDNAAIFEIHQMMLEDLDYIESVEGIIRTQQVNAEYAVQTTAANFAEIFSSMEDAHISPFLRSRMDMILLSKVFPSSHCARALKLSVSGSYSCIPL